MAWLTNTMSNILKRTFNLEALPNEVIEVKTDKYDDRPIIYREESIFLYAGVGDLKYDIVMHKPFSQSLSDGYSLFRSEERHLAEEKFIILKDKLTILLNIANSVSLGAVIEPKPVEEDHVPSLMLMTKDLRSSRLIVNSTQEMAIMDKELSPRMELTDTGRYAQVKQKLQRNEAVETAISSLLVKFAEAVSKAAALPIAVAISLVNKVSSATNSTLHVGGELTKLPVTITNSIIQELSNITFPN